VLVEGLDASGRVVVRTRVNEPFAELTTDDDEPVPSEAALEGLVRATNRWVD
jgi:hypothetical protein